MLTDGGGGYPLASLRFDENPDLRCRCDYRRRVMDDKLGSSAVQATALARQLR